MTADTNLRDRAASAGARTDRPPAPSSGAEVATTEKKQTLAAMVTQLKPELARALPRHISVDRVARIAITALRRTPKLNDCTPESFLGALLTASQLGLEVNTPAGEAWLIPYKRECTLVIGYQGIVKLFWQHPQAKHIDAQAVYAADEFSYAYGLDPHLTHKPAPAPRGELVAYYAVATLQNGGSAFVVLTPEEVKALRQGKVGPSGDIADPQRWMERKTALKQMLKLLPKTVELTAAVAADEQVRTDYTSSLESADFTPPAVIEVAREPEQVAAAPVAAAAESAADGAGEAQQPAEADAAPVQTEDGLDACPQCGGVPACAASACPMDADIAGSGDADAQN